MAEQIFELDYTREEFKTYLKRSFEGPFVIYEDIKDECFRFFLTDKFATDWFAERDLASIEGRAMDPEIIKYEFTGNSIPGTPNYSASIEILHGDGENTIEGSTGNYISFRPLIEDRSKNDTKESIDIYINISNNGEAKTPIYLIEKSNSLVLVNIDDYIKLGDNDIVITIKGRANGVSKTIVMTYSQFRLLIESGFNISQTIAKNTDFSVNCNVKGNGQKEVRFYIDGKQVASKVVSALDSDANISLLFTNTDGTYKPGKHNLQIYAISNGYPSNLLYYEFIINGIENDYTTCLVQYVFPSGTEPFVGNIPGFYGEQYVSLKLKWAYYTNDNKVRNPKITWRLYDASGVETHLATRTADVVEAETDKMPDPIEFMPSGFGAYKLQAIIDNYDYYSPDRHIKGVLGADHDDPKGLIACYTIDVIKNTNGVEEATEGLEFKISGLGRSNDEPDTTRTDLSYNGIKGTFHNMPWNNRYGYYNNAIVFGGGAYYTIPLNPLDSIHDAKTNGCSIEIDLETYEIKDENAILFILGDVNGTHLVVKPTTIEFKTDLGTGPKLRFRQTERHKFCFVIHPDTNLAGNRRRFIELYVDGIRSGVVQYGTTDNLVINTGGIRIGDPEGGAGIKVYYFETFKQVLLPYNELNNFIIHSGSNIAALVKRNDIYIEGSRNTISVDKLKAILPVWEFTGPLNRMITSSDKITIKASGKYTDTEHPDLYMEGAELELKTSGESSLSDKMAKGIHVKFNKGTNQIKNAEGKAYYGNRWTPFPGNCPERKIRLNADGLESSHTHNMCIENIINEVFPKVKIGEEYVLRSPALQYVLSGDYAKDMYNLYKGNISDYEFPYKINYAADWKPVAVVWRPDINTDYELFGIFSMGEEKKSDFAHGRRSIYLKKPLENGQLDPFDMLPGEKGPRGFDNSGIVQIEMVRDSEITFMINAKKWDTDNRNDCEKVYSDEDDLKLEENNREWKLFGDEVIKPIAALYQGTRKNENGIPYAYGNQDGFHKLFFGGTFNVWSFIAARIIIRKCGLTDTLVRNSQWVRFPTTYLSTNPNMDNRKFRWWFAYWDLDMAFGLQLPSGALVINPGLDRDDKVGDNFVFTGKRVGTPESSWFWDAYDKEIELGKERLAKAVTDLLKIDAQKENLHYMTVQLEDALDDAGFNVANLLKLMKEAIDKYGEALYNSDGETKYIDSYAEGADYLLRLQGSRLSHLNWWVYESFEKWNAQVGTKAYQTNAVSIRLSKNLDDSGIVKLKAGAPSYFGWGLTSTVMQSGIYHTTGDEFTFDLAGRALNSNDPLKIYMPNKLEELDLSSMAHRIGGNVEFTNFYNEGTGIYIRKINIGVPKEYMQNGIYNTFTAKTWTGLNNLTTLEEFNIQGHKEISSNGTIDISKMNNLGKLYLAGSIGFTSLTPAPGVHIIDYELPISIQSLELTSCTIDTTKGITWWDGPNQTTLPTSLRTLSMTQGMGSDLGALKLMKDWLDMVYPLSLEQRYSYKLTYNNVWIDGIDWKYIELICQMKESLGSSMNISGYIKCNQEYTVDLMNYLMKVFGKDIFDKTNNIVFDCDSEKVIISASGTGTSVNELGEIVIIQGTSSQFQSVGFPLVGERPTYSWYVEIDGSPLGGTSLAPWYEFDEYFKLNFTTGELQTLECPLQTKIYKLVCRGSNLSSGNIIVNIIPRTYPNKVDINYIEGSSEVANIDGINQILRGQYIFDAIHKRIIDGLEQEYSGTFKEENGGVWEVSLGDNPEELMSTDLSQYIKRMEIPYGEGKSPFNEYCLNVFNLPSEELNILLKYVSNWKNNLSITSDPVKLSIIAVLTQVLNDDAVFSNRPLYAAIKATGIPQSQANTFNSMELKRIQGTFSIKDALSKVDEFDETSLTSFMGNSDPSYPNILRFLKNVDKLDVSDCINLKETDLTPMTFVQEVDMTNTTSSIKVGPNTKQLATLTLGNPESIEIVNAPKLNYQNINITSAFNTKNIKLENVLGGSFKVLYKFK